MRIALLGADEDTLRLAAAAIADGHTLSAAAESGAFAAEVRRLAPLLEPNAPWENLLAGSPAEVVLVGVTLPGRAKDDPRSAEDIRSEQLRRLAQEELPLVLIPPGCDLDTGYELEAIRRDRNGFVAAWIDDWNHPAWDRVEALLTADATGPLGGVEKLTWERYLPDRSRAAVRKQFVADLAVLRRLFGPIRTIYAGGAHGETHYDPFAPKRGAPELDQVTIQVGVDRPCVVRWSAEPVVEGEAGRVTLVGKRASWELIQSADEDWAEEVAGIRTPIPLGGGSLWTTLAAQLRGERPCGALPLWFDTCRDLESLEAIDRSLARGRTVALHAEETDEAEAFKSVMASGGCLILSLIPVLLVAGIALDQLGLTFIRRWWVPGLIALIVVFLLLQSLRLFTRPKPQAG